MVSNPPYVLSFTNSKKLNLKLAYNLNLTSSIVIIAPVLIIVATNICLTFINSSIFLSLSFKKLVIFNTTVFDYKFNLNKGI